MKGISIQTRVFILALLPTLILSVLLGIYIIVSRIHDLEKELRLHGELILSHIVNSSRRGLLKEQHETLHNLTNMILEETDLLSVSLFGSKHELLAYSGNDDSQSPEIFKNIIFDDTTPTSFETSDTLTLTAPIVTHHLQDNPAVIGWVTINMSRTTTVLKEYQVILVTIIILSLGILLSIFLARRTARRLTYPLYKMRSAVKQLEQGLLETRVSTGTTGEMSELEEGINKMAAALQDARDELQTNIDQATSDLQQSLEIIEKKNIELAEAQKEALEGSRIKSEFIANMSHEIRTPMNGIIGFANLLLETDLTTLQRNYLNTIQKSTFNLLSLVNNILDFSRLDAGQLRLEYLSFDIRDCIEDAVTIMSPLANGKQLEFAAIIDNDVPKKIISDPLRLKQIMVNLISNAIKFTDKGDVSVRVSVEKKTNLSVKLRFAITDSGIGLPLHDQEFIFRAFQQADNSIARKYGGTGLGLAICKKLIDQMAGQIGVESAHGKGSTFWFTITAEHTAADMISDYDIVNFNHAHIFLYEPHLPTQESVTNFLTGWQINVTTFTDYATLIQALQEQTQPTFIIMGMTQQLIKNGMASDFIAQLKNSYQGPILTLTNSSEQSVFEYFISEGATLSLTKPITRTNLYHAISQLINSSRIAPVIYPDKLSAEIGFIDLFDKHILCVDDNHQNANLVSTLLQQCHATISIAHDGLEALQMTKKQQFDLILMDLRMPKMDGHEALKQIRFSKKNPNMQTPVIALSAHISSDESLELSHAGFNDYLTKPIIKNYFFKIVKKWIHAKIPLATDIPVIDWELGIKLANNKKEIAEEMLLLLVKSLPSEFADIKSAYENQQHSDLLQRLHKLHGALCYCGVPRLKDSIAVLEAAIKKNHFQEIPTLFARFDFEVKEFFKQSSEFIRIYTQTPHHEREKE